MLNNILLILKNIFNRIKPKFKEFKTIVGIIIIALPILLVSDSFHILINGIVNAIVQLLLNIASNNKLSDIIVTMLGAWLILLEKKE